MNHNNLTPSLFETFNARFSTPSAIAQTFVPSQHFDDLSKPTHTLIVGPRGSGKTTLLKMLQCEALEAWQDDIATAYRNNIQFTGVFIPTDVNWSKQIHAIGENVGPKIADILAKAVFTTHVLYKLICTIIYRTSPIKNLENSILFRRVLLTQDQESNFVCEISKIWRLDTNIPSLLSLKHSLLARSSKIFELASTLECLDEQHRNEHIANLPYLHLDFLKSASIGIEIFEDQIGVTNEKWAFLFDELELAPTSIVQELVDSTRSTDERILFKLSLVPFNPEINFINDMFSGMPSNDYEVIPLWYENKEKATNFSNALLDSMMKRRGITDIDKHSLFKAPFKGPTSLKTKEHAYSPESYQGKLIKRMSENDFTFKSYLNKKGIDPNRLDLIKGDKRADIRKIITILMVRDTYRATDSARRSSKKNISSRSRKNPNIYTGIDSLFAIVEGNPRWFIGIIGALLNEYTQTGKPVSYNKQKVVVNKAVQRFRALLKTIPCPNPQYETSPKSVESLLKDIGNYVHKNVVTDKFNPEPYGSFNLDEGAQRSLIESLGLALNAGAIVYVSGHSSEIAIDSLEKKRFRISYLLAPFYKIPLTLMRPIGLKTILRKIPNQQTLFDL